jgi:hypothetical protein
VLHVAESVDYWTVGVLGKLVDGVSFEDPGDQHVAHPSHDVRDVHDRFA